MNGANALQESIWLWREAFYDEDTGIETLTSDLLWDHAVFCTVAKIVDLSELREDSRCRLNQPIFNLIGDGYWSRLLLGVRRLLDGGHLRGQKGVNSLGSIISDVRNKIGALTRETYVTKVHGARYDLEAMQLEQQRTTLASGGATWGSKEIPKSEAAHKLFDHLSGVASSQRHPNDAVSMPVLEKITGRIKKLRSEVDFVNPNFTHSGTRESREGREIPSMRITDARDLLKQVTELAHLVGEYFAVHGVGRLASYNGDQFEGLEYPVIEPGDIPLLQQQWDEIRREMERWSVDLSEL